MEPILPENQSSEQLKLKLDILGYKKDLEVMKEDKSLTPVMRILNTLPPIPNTINLPAITLEK